MVLAGGGTGGAGDPLGDFNGGKGGDGGAATNGGNGGVIGGGGGDGGGGGSGGDGGAGSGTGVQGDGGNGTNGGTGGDGNGGALGGFGGGGGGVGTGTNNGSAGTDGGKGNPPPYTWVTAISRLRISCELTREPLESFLVAGAWPGSDRSRSGPGLGRVGHLGGQGGRRRCRRRLVGPPVSAMSTAQIPRALAQAGFTEPRYSYDQLVTQWLFMACVGGRVGSQPRCHP